MIWFLLVTLKSYTFQSLTSTQYCHAEGRADRGKETDVIGSDETSVSARPFFINDTSFIESASEGVVINLTSVSKGFIRLIAAQPKSRSQARIVS